jgi:deoxycytidylate deaminase/dephospho-CoA kinase
MPNSTSSPPLVIGLTGPIGSGVSSVATILASKGFHRIGLSEPIKDQFRNRHDLTPSQEIKAVTGWRQELQNIGDEGRNGGNLHAWAEKALSGAPKGRDLVIDGFRNAAEVQYLRHQCVKSYLIAVVADRKVRWERVKDDYGHREKEFELADERDSEDKDDLPHGQQVGRCVANSDYVLVNSDPLTPGDRRDAVLWEKLEGPIELMRGTRKENPKEHEAHMAEAYALSHRSRCLKRHVGAIIIDGNGLPLSSGFNENPVGMLPCMFQFNNTCYKDNLMHEKLEKMRDFYCPQCGGPVPKTQKPWKCPKCRVDLKKQFFPSRNMEFCTALHAEERAVRSLHGRSAEGGTMYVTAFPCLQCARYVVDAGIKKIVYVEAYPVKEAYDYLILNKVQVEPFNGFKARPFHIIFQQVD